MNKLRRKLWYHLWIDASSHHAKVLISVLMAMIAIMVHALISTISATKLQVIKHSMILMEPGVLENLKIAVSEPNAIRQHSVLLIIRESYHAIMLHVLTKIAILLISSCRTLIQVKLYWQNQSLRIGALVSHAQEMYPVLVVNAIMHPAYPLSSKSQLAMFQSVTKYLTSNHRILL